MVDSDIFNSTSPWISDETREFLKPFESVVQDAQDAGEPPLLNGQICYTLFGKTYLLPNSMAISKHLSWDDPVYHFIKLEHLEEMIQTKSLYFHKVISWDDPWEIPYRYFHLTRQEKNRDLINAEHMYGICWTNKFDTDAMWRIYSKVNKKNKTKDYSVCIATTVKQLYNALHRLRTTESNLFMAPVQYIDLTPTNINEIINSNEAQYYPQYMYPAFIKRTEFEHEHEIRLLLFCLDPSKFHKNLEISKKCKKRENDGIQIPIPNLDFINEIILDPRLSDTEVAELQKRLGGHFDTIRKSELYSIDHIIESLDSAIQKTDTYSQNMPIGASSFLP